MVLEVMETRVLLQRPDLKGGEGGRRGRGRQGEKSERERETSMEGIPKGKSRTLAVWSSEHEARSVPEGSHLTTFTPFCRRRIEIISLAMHSDSSEALGLSANEEEAVEEVPCGLGTFLLADLLPVCRRG